MSQGSLPAPDTTRVLVVEVAAPGGHRLRPGRVPALGVALLIAAFAVLWLADRSPAGGATRQRGAAGVAAAYGYPLRCLSVTILAQDRAYARADFDHLSRCGQYTWYPTAIFHYAAGKWRIVLDAINYACPVAPLPRPVQSELGVCDLSGGQSGA